jgi:hypothetical protein
VRIGVAIVLGVLALAPFALACRPPRQSGEDLGTFLVVGTLETNACAPGLPTLDPVQFRIQLRRDASSLTWRIAPDGPPVMGVLRDDGTFRVRSDTPVRAWPADPANGVVGCTLVQSEIVEGSFSSQPAVDAGPPAPGDAGADAGPPRPTSFAASHRIEVTLSAGSDCSRLLVANGGSFPSLPCAAEYQLEATRD